MIGLFMSAPTQTHGPLVISIKEARKLLGQISKTLSDNQIVELIQTLTVVADNFLLDLGSTNYNGK